MLLGNQTITLAHNLSTFLDGFLYFLFSPLTPTHLPHLHFQWTLLPIWLTKLRQSKENSSVLLTPHLCLYPCFPSGTVDGLSMPLAKVSSSSWPLNPNPFYLLKDIALAILHSLLHPQVFSVLFKQWYKHAVFPPILRKKPKNSIDPPPSPPYTTHSSISLYCKTPWKSWIYSLASISLLPSFFWTLFSPSKFFLSS